jgi:hypothetical protein
MRNYTITNLWGPFLDDGEASVDWERMEAVMIVLGYNLKRFSENTGGRFDPVWTEPWRGANSQSFQTVAMPRDKGKGKAADEDGDEEEEEEPGPEGPQVEGDPYNISGTWMRVVCFLGEFFFSPTIIPISNCGKILIGIDFHELHHYNFGLPAPAPSTPRPPIDTTEAIRMIIMELTVTSIAHLGEPDGPGPTDHPDFPVVYFKGMSRSMHQNWDPNANSKIRGRVSVTKEGEVRWTTWSIYWG